MVTGITLLTGVIIHNSPQVVILSMISGSIEEIRKGILSYFLTVAKAVILVIGGRHTLWKWVFEMDIFRIELLLAQGKYERYSQMLISWKVFRESWGFKDMITI